MEANQAVIKWALPPPSPRHQTSTHPSRTISNAHSSLKPSMTSQAEDFPIFSTPVYTLL